MTSQESNQRASAEPDSSRPVTSRKRRALSFLAVTVASAALCAGLYFEIHGRTKAKVELKDATEAQSILNVRVVHPASDTMVQEILLPGNVQAFKDTPIFARTSGYLRHWYFDIGSKVRQGDLLAEIDTPEIDEQLRQARGDLATATANLKLANITARRNEKLLSTNSVSTQDRDDAVAAFEADQAIVRAQQANVARLERLQSYEKVYAPFDGVITARNTDFGALVDADANAPAQELFHLSAVDRLRVFVAVPEVYANAARSGAEATLTLDEFPGETFSGVLERTSESIDLSSRTLLIEVDIENSDNRLLPGAYAFVHVKVPEDSQALTIPVSTLLFRKEGLQVVLVRDGHTLLVPIKIGRDYGDKVQVVAGLQSTDAVIIDPSDSIVSGIAVRLVQNDPAGTTP